MIELQIIQKIQRMIRKKKWIKIIILFINHKNQRIKKLVVYQITNKIIKNMEMMI